MASWEITIEIANLDSKLANVTATRTDGEVIEHFNLHGVSVDTRDKPLSGIRAAVVARLWAMHEKNAADNAKIAALLAGWQAALVSDLNALET